MLQHTEWLGFHFPTTSVDLSGALCALSFADLGVLRRQGWSVEARALFTALNLLWYDLDQVTHSCPPNWSIVRLESHNKSQSAKGPAGLSGPASGLSCPFCFMGYVNATFSMCYLCCRFSDACAHSFLLAWFNSHPNTHHLVILPNVWSYLAICFSTQFPGPYMSILHPSSCLGTSLCISDLSGADLCSSDIWILAISLPDVPS